MKKIAIIQSNYIPWKGYFDMIGLVDEFILFDEVQYTKNDWRNRNKIKTPNGPAWLTIPVFHKTLNQKISETQITDKRWPVKHWNSIVSNYTRAKYFETFRPAFEQLYSNCKSTYLSDINYQFIVLICQVLNIKTTITSSRNFYLGGNPTEKLVNLCKQTGAISYLSGPAAKNYLDESLFVQEGISVEWMDYSDYPEYEQLYPPFAQQVSIIDLIFNVGANASQYMKFKTKWN